MSRTGHRNGFYERLLVTPYGTVSIQVPRLREGSYEHVLFGRQRLLTQEVCELILEAYLAGISTRRVGEVLEKSLGYKVSAGTVSEILGGLDKLLREFWRKPIEDKWGVRHLRCHSDQEQERGRIGEVVRLV